MTIHENLKELRLSRSMTQEQVAEKLNVTRQTVSSYESGRTRPDVDTLVRLSEVYGTDLDAIIYGQEKAIKDTRLIKFTAKIVFAVLVLLSLVCAVLFLGTNLFFPLSEGVITEEMMPVFESHIAINKAWQFLDSALLILSFVCFAVLLIMLIIGKGRIPVKHKLIYAGVLVVALILIAVVFSLIDQKYSLKEYILTPIAVTLRLSLFLIADILIEWIKYKKKKD